MNEHEAVETPDAESRKPGPDHVNEAIAVGNYSTRLDVVVQPILVEG